MSRRRGAGVALALALVVAGLDGAVLLTRAEDPVAAPTAGGTPEAGASAEPETETLPQQIERVARIVAEVRSLTFDRVPSPTYLTPDEVAERVRTATAEYTTEDAELDARAYALLGAVPPGFDLREAVSTVLAEQVVGFYDPETEELVVSTREPGSRLSPFEELTLAHELEHALADQAVGLPELDRGEEREDASLARQALVEGDATLTMQEYVAPGFSVVDQLRLATESFQAGQQLESLAGLPHVLRRSLEFPYVEGMAFVRDLRARGGWPAVDRAYGQPPASTDQILFPDRFRAGVSPRATADGGELDEPWVRRRRMALGAADLLFLFEAPGDDPDRALEAPVARVRAWAGGRLELWTAGDASAVALALADRTSGELCDSMQLWYAAAYPDVSPAVTRPGEVLAVDGPRQDAVFRCPDGQVRVGIGPDLATARRLAS